MSLKLQSKPSAKVTRAPPSAPLYLLDGHSLTFKAYYGIRRLTAPDGSPIGAVYGFLRMLLRLMQDLQPQYLAVVFDTGEPTFREEIYSEYKANREGPPPDFSDQMQWIARLLKAMNIASFSKVGYEADDLIATMATEVGAAGGSTFILSADKDLFQLVDDRTTMLRFGTEDLDRYDAEAVVERLGVKPEQVPDWLALVGDSSDNIPGVPSIGEKGAAKLLQEFGTIEAMLSHPDRIKNPRHSRAIAENADQARLSLRLATVVRDVAFDWQLEQCRLPESVWNEESIAILSDLGFESILRDYGLEQPEKQSNASGASIKATSHLVYDPKELKQWVMEAAEAKWLALDTETTGLNPMLADLVGISLSYRAGDAIYIPVSHRVGAAVDRQIPVEQLHELLAPLFSPATKGCKAPALTAHHAKYDWKILERAGFKIDPPKFDSMVASFVLDPGRRSGHGLKALGSEFCGIRMRPITEIIGSGKNAITIDEVPPEDVCEYACLDADVTLRLTEILSEKLGASPSLERLFNEIEIPLIPVLHRMEIGGFTVDADHPRRLSKTMEREVTRLGREIWKAAGREFNIDSTRQLADVLFNGLGLPTGKKTKTGFSTDSSVLEGLLGQHPIAELIIEYRTITKLKSTYADALPRQVNPRTGRIHTSFNQTIAATGRLSSTDPNLQNIPIRTELGREIRRTFIPDGPEHRLLSADYSQVELRIMAHFSGDATLREAYEKGRDIHALTAVQVFGVLEEDVTKEMRAQAKVINFGIIYGISAFGLATRLGIPRNEAAKVIETYFATYPGVRRWIDEMLEKARQDGYVETLMGRRRWLPDLTAKNGMLRSNAERIAVNSPLQGTSADMIKIAMIRIDRGLSKVSPEARMVLQVHDELIFSVPKPDLDVTGEFIRKEMRDALPLDVPIVVDVSVGENWAQC